MLVNGVIIRQDDASALLNVHPSAVAPLLLCAIAFVPNARMHPAVARRRIARPTRQSQRRRIVFMLPSR
ncbi:MULTISPECIES: hypothetical protein [Burkholderia]|uniref:Uncharacterized protein n=1 Tax=Burkholderia semiarida TaxID=2843303 RepID=A0ABW7LB33_9BURK|nr:MULTISPECIES: hypothetical protein [Burkholderia]MCA7969383.1 hypothetical protein [Burkholderia sp. AU39826]MCA8035445.1 hypothetical protein [Burkholderia arboris]MCA8241211.1 hypothetical protein [Burkholderia sp. AU32262]